MTVNHEKSRELYNKICDIINDGEYIAPEALSAVIQIFSAITDDCVAKNRQLEFVAQNLLRTIVFINETYPINDSALTEYSAKILPYLEEFHEKVIAPNNKKEEI
jgi:hypothetical protein